jgi:hypothetical protein
MTGEHHVGESFKNVDERIRMRVINLNRVVGGEMSRFTSVLFDLDGALVDPGQGIAGTIQFVLDSLGAASTKRLSSSYFFRQHIPQRSGEPVEFPHNKHVALAELNQEPMQFRSVPAPARRFLAIDSLAPHPLSAVTCTVVSCWLVETRA